MWNGLPLPAGFGSGLTLPAAAVRAATAEAPRVCPDLTHSSVPAVSRAMESLEHARIEGIDGMDGMDGDGNGDGDGDGSLSVVGPEARDAMSAAAERARRSYQADTLAVGLHTLGIYAIQQPEQRRRTLCPAEVAAKSAGVAEAAREGHLSGKQVAEVMRTWARLATHAGMSVDDAHLRAMSDAIENLEGSAAGLELHHKSIVEDALTDIAAAAAGSAGAAEKGRERSSTSTSTFTSTPTSSSGSGARTPQPSCGLDADVDADVDVKNAFERERARWMTSLPAGKRGKLEVALDAATSFEAELELVVASAEGDSTKVRAAAKRALLETADRVRRR